MQLIPDGNGMIPLENINIIDLMTPLENKHVIQCSSINRHRNDFLILSSN